MVTMKLGAEQIVYGEGAVQGLRELKGNTKKAYIVMSGHVQEELGQLKLVTDELEAAGFAWKAYFDVEPEPSFETIQKGAADMLAFEPDWIIGFGGGSAMDAAKAMWVFYENPQCKTLAEVAVPNQVPELKKKARLVCIPTSTGTGSEVTRVAVITDTQLKRKFSVRCTKGNLIPDVAILDPVFAATMPRKLIAASGMDALTHAIEAYVTPFANPFSDALAKEAVELIFDNLANFYNDPNNVDARMNMLAASCMAGIAFANSGLGIVHSIAHTFGSEYGVPHGLANAITLPYVMRFNESDVRVKERYARLAFLIQKDSLVNAVEELCKVLDLPPNMAEAIPGEKDVLDKIEALTEKALGDVCVFATPVKPDGAQMATLIKGVYLGK